MFRINKKAPSVDVGRLSSLLAHEASVLDRHGMVHTEHASRWARQEHALLRDLSAALAFEEERLQSAMGYDIVLVPMRRPSGPEER